MTFCVAEEETIAALKNALAGGNLKDSLKEPLPSPLSEAKSPRDVQTLQELEQKHPIVSKLPSSDRSALEKLALEVCVCKRMCFVLIVCVDQDCAEQRGASPEA